MTVSSGTNKASYSGNGTLTTFAYTFKVFDQDDLTVILRAPDGAETTQTITTHYTVTGVGDAGGGNVVFATAPLATETVVILREQALTQGLDLVPNDPFPADSIEDTLDKLTFMIQQHQEELDRSVKGSKTNTISNPTFTEDASQRANKVFAFDANGDIDITQEIGTYRGNWSASRSYYVRDLVQDSGNDNVYICITAHTSSGSLPLKNNGDISKWVLIINAEAAAASAAAAAASAAAGLVSETNAATSAAAALVSEGAAATSETNAATSESNAATSEGNANAAAVAAAASAVAAAGSAAESDAQTQAIIYSIALG